MEVGSARAHDSARPGGSARSGERALVVAHLGLSGSFSEEAALAYAERAGLALEPQGNASFEAVLASLAEGRAGLAVVPVANSTGGLVQPALAALCASALELVDEVVLPVRLSLWVRCAETGLDALERVASHPQAFRQCARFLARELPGRAQLEWSDTASAARDLALGVLDERVGVLASRRAGEIHGLVCRLADVQDDPRNRTFFAVVRRRSS